MCDASTWVRVARHFSRIARKCSLSRSTPRTTGSKQRAARRFPLILERLADGSIHLTAVRLLEPHLTSENHRDMLDAARHKTKRAIEELIARLHPQPDAPPLVRKLPAPALAGPPAQKLIAETLPPVASVVVACAYTAGAHPADDRDPARARALQGAVHRVKGDV
jgi:hypothetical protein